MGHSKAGYLDEELDVCSLLPTNVDAETLDAVFAEPTLSSMNTANTGVRFQENAKY